jgi:hypothetical protein
VDIVDEASDAEDEHPLRGIDTDEAAGRDAHGPGAHPPTCRPRWHYLGKRTLSKLFQGTYGFRLGEREGEERGLQADEFWVCVVGNRGAELV